MEARRPLCLLQCFPGAGMRDACVIKMFEGIAQCVLAIVQHMVVRQADIPDTSGLQDADGAGRGAKVEDLRRPCPRIAPVADRAFQIG